MTTPAHVLVVTSSGASANVVVPVLAAAEATGMRVRAIDVGGAGGGGGGVADRVRRALLGESAERRLRRELETSPPDVALAFDPHAAIALSVARDHAPTPAVVVAVVGELEPASEWRAVEADRYLCVDDAAAVALADLGIDGARVLVVGSFGERVFVDAAREDRGVLRTRFGIKGTPVLVEAAGLGAEAAGQLVLQLSLVTGAEHLTYLFDAGGDAEAAGVIRRQAPALGLRAKLFGATTDAPLLWRAAEVVVARVSPAAASRAQLVGARLVGWIDDSSPYARLASGLEQRRRAQLARGPLLIAGALEAALRAPAPALLADGAEAAAEVLAAVAADKRGVIEERHEAARAAAAAQQQGVASAARASAAAGDLEDLGGDDVEAVAGPPPWARPAAAPPPAGSSARPVDSVDDALASLKRQAAAGGAPRPGGPGPSRSASPPGPSRPTPVADDPLAALKRKMAADALKKK